MPDSFFSSSKSRKRKRSTTTTSDDNTRNAKKIARKGPSPSPRLTTRKSSKRAAKSTPGPGSGSGTKVNGAREKKAPRKKTDEELLSDQTDNDDEGGGIEDLDLRVATDSDDAGGDHDGEDLDETPAEKRLRLARLYLESVKEDLADGEFDAAEIDNELISARLKHDVMENSGKVHLFIAESFDFSEPPTTVLRTRGHRLSVTSAVASEDGKYLFTSGKEGSIIKWDLTNGKKLATFHKFRIPNADAGKGKGKGKGKALGGTEANGHTDEVLALALSGDGKYLASGGKDRRVGVWDVEKGEWVKGLGGHRDTISALAFRKGTQQLYSGSFDRTLKLFDLSVLGYVETLFGHQDSVLAIDAIRGETAVSVGGRDKTVRFWKIVDETQLVFRGGGRSAVRDLLEGGALEGIDGNEGEGEGDGDEMALDKDHHKSKERKGKMKKFVEGSVECVAMIDETTFVSGGDSGSICLWTIQRKKPIYTHALAHGFNDVHSATEGLIQTPRWVTAIAAFRYSDLIASGSWEGDIRIWKLDSKVKSFSLAGTVPIPGVINSLQFISPPKNFMECASWTAPRTCNSAMGNPNAPDSPPEAVTATTTTTTTTRANGGDDDDTIIATKKKLPIRTNLMLLVVGVGQEHRLGRWMKLKGNGIINGTVVVAFSPRTS